MVNKFRKQLEFPWISKPHSTPCLSTMDRFFYLHQDKIHLAVWQYARKSYKLFWKFSLVTIVCSEEFSSHPDNSISIQGGGVNKDYLLYSLFAFSLWLLLLYTYLYILTRHVYRFVYITARSYNTPQVVKLLGSFHYCLADWDGRCVTVL